MNITADTRNWITRVGFVIVTLGLLGYLNYINENGQFNDLIVGIIGIFIGVASTAAKVLISGESENKIEQLTERVNEMEKRYIEMKTMAATYRDMFENLQQKLIDQAEFKK